jgi:hypothetical protein
MKLALSPTGTLQLRGDGICVDVDRAHPSYPEFATAFLQAGGSLFVTEPIPRRSEAELDAWGVTHKPPQSWYEQDDNADPAWPQYHLDGDNLSDKLPVDDGQLDSPSEGEALAKAVAARWNERESQGDEIPPDELEADAATLAPFGWCLEFCGMDGWQARQCDPGRGDLMPGTACAAGKVLKLSAWVDPEEAVALSMGDLHERIEAAAKYTHPAPTEAMRKAGNYRKGRVSLHGLQIAIENPKGSVRKGAGPDGKPWQVTMECHYGYIHSFSPTKLSSAEFDPKKHPHKPKGEGGGQFAKLSEQHQGVLDAIKNRQVHSGLSLARHVGTYTHDPANQEAVTALNAIGGHLGLPALKGGPQLGTRLHRIIGHLDEQGKLKELPSPEALEAARVQQEQRRADDERQSRLKAERPALEQAKREKPAAVEQAAWDTWQRQGEEAERQAEEARRTARRTAIANADIDSISRDRIADWVFYDDEGHLFDQTVYLEHGQYFDNEARDRIKAEIDRFTSSKDGETFSIQDIEDGTTLGDQGAVIDIDEAATIPENQRRAAMALHRQWADADLATDVWRWVSVQDDSGPTDRGQWTENDSEARAAGLRYANSENMSRPDEESEDEDDDPGDDEADEIFGSSKLGLRVSRDGNDVTIRHPKIDDCQRTLGTDRNGDKFIRNNIFKLHSEDRDSGWGSKVFAAQVEGASAAGYSYIETHAAKGGGYNGYYTWPRLGYDQDLDTLDDDTQEAIRDMVPDAESVQDLFDVKELDLDPEDHERLRRGLAALGDTANGEKKSLKRKFSGSDWWLINGEALQHAVFDLEEGSRSRRVLAAFMREKGR